MTINMTDTERLILRNQYEILEKLEPKNAEQHQKFQVMLENGYLHWFSSRVSGYLSEALTAEQEKEVIDILAMFWDMELAYDQLEDKSGINEHWVRFQGFDGNHEGEYLGFATFLIEKEQRFSGLTPHLNSHHQVLPMYRRMLVEWEKCENPCAPSKEDIIRITEASIPAERRQLVG